MPDLEDVLRRLSASFAEEVIAALREVPLEDLLALSDEGGARDRPAAPARARRPRPKKMAVDIVDGRRPDASADGRPSTDVLEAAERLFVERGARGATAAQLAELLAARGVAVADGAADVIRTLVERESIRDAGFRRTTGNGTAPVFVTTR